VAKGAEQLKDFRRQAAEFEKKGDEAELDAIGKIYYQRDQLLQQAAKVKASESEIAAIRKAADEQAAVLSKKAWEEFEKYADKQAAEQQQENARTHDAEQRADEGVGGRLRRAGTDRGHRGPGAAR
jgi:hypothetical protein